MTRFNPEKNNKTPEEWSEVALRATQENHLQWNVIGGIVLGVLASSAASPITGGLVVAYFLWDSWRKAGQIQRNQAAIAELGCVAQVLDGDNFADYTRQVGKEVVINELNFANERGLALSDAAADFYEDNQPSITSNSTPLLTAAKTLLEKPFCQIPVQTQVDNYNPAAATEIDIVGQMSANIENLFIVGLGRSGKGILLSNVIRQVKRHDPSKKIFLINGKDDWKEYGYFDGIVDVEKRLHCETAKPQTVAAWFEAAIAEYDQYALVNDGALLIIDEGTIIGARLKVAKCTLLSDKLIGIASCGSSAGKNIWFIAQTPFVGANGSDLSGISQLTPIALVHESNLAVLDTWKTARLFKKFDTDKIAELINNSECSRAIYYGKTTQWYSMPVLENHSAFNRDQREFLPGFEPSDDSICNNQGAISRLNETLDIGEQPTTIQNHLGLSDLAKRLLSFFDNAKNKEPKTLADIKKKDELREQGDIKLITALNELVNAGQLIFDGEDSWSKFDW
ncbi:hypothetical protein LC608_30455 [Nostoc sp. XA010]|uniref:hypothetical protein n=1 Tax=Nostoc sp. XA010 TaxID=2780407 RepID=UPI001E65A179|nr:hypothetical protein [Nostoc sp. XA010]MCC5661208.1 hypothetical protein [Nostoc sp. XA010]